MYTADATDLQLPTPGFPLVAARTYESSHLIDGPLGYGWTSSLTARLYYATYLLAAPDVVQLEAYVIMPTGARYRFSQNPDGTFKPPLGRHDTLRRNADGTFDLTLQRTSSVLHFDNNGVLRTAADDYGNQLVYSYETNGRLQRIADAAGSQRYIDLYWGADGRISSLVDSAGRQVGYVYDVRGVLTSTTDPLGRLTTYVYASGKYVPLLVAVKDNWNRVVTEISYDGQNRATSYTEDGETYSYTFNYQGNPTKTAKTDSTGNTWVFVHGPGGLVASDIAPSGGGALTTSYYPDGSIQQVTDGVGIKTYYTYDSQGRETSVTKDYQGPKAVRYEYTYDAEFPNKISGITTKVPATGQPNQDWQAVRFDYYSAGTTAPGALKHRYRVRRNGALDLLMTFEYDTRGRVTAEIDASGGRTDYAYDAKGDLISVVGPANSDSGNRPVTEYSYDALGRIAATRDAMGRESVYAYDNLDRLLEVKLPLPAPDSPTDFITSINYDLYDPVSGLVFEETTDPSGHVNRLGKDQFGRTVRLINPLGAVTHYSYVGGKLRSTTDANGNVMSFGYDAFGRLSQKTFPSGAVESYAYWPDGQLKSKTDRKGQTTSYEYDAFKRLMRRSYGSAGAVTFTYAGAQLLRVDDTTVADGESHTLMYDDAYRVLSDTQADRGTIVYQYTPTDRVASYSVNGGATASYTYYPDQSVRTISWNRIDGEFKYDYNAAGQYERIVFPNGQERRYSYDGQGRLWQLANVHPSAGILASYVYGYDLDPGSGEASMIGQRTGIVSTVPAMGFLNAETKLYYDQGDQLVRADYPASSYSTAAVHQWTYDAIGNRLTATLDGARELYTYVKNGQGSTDGERLESAGTITFTYDANGNVTTRSGPVNFTFTWNRDDRMTAVAGGASASYAYDHLGRRSKRIVQGEQRYVFDGINMVAATGTANSEYLYGPGVDEPLAVYQDGTVLFYAVDGLGSTALIDGEDGAIAESFLHGVWGERLAAPGSSTNPITYTGREWDPEAGLYYYRNRYYSSTTGSFLSEDPINEALLRLFLSGRAGRFDPLSSYRYARNSPAMFSDPLGFSPEECRANCEKAYEKAVFRCLKTYALGQLGCVLTYAACTLGTRDPLRCALVYLICEVPVTLYFRNCKADASSDRKDCVDHCLCAP